jgi:hypothetical protein
MSGAAWPGGGRKRGGESSVWSTGRGRLTGADADVWNGGSGPGILRELPDGRRDGSGPLSRPPASRRRPPRAASAPRPGGSPTPRPECRTGGKDGRPDVRSPSSRPRIHPPTPKRSDLMPRPTPWRTSRSPLSHALAFAFALAAALAAACSAPPAPPSGPYAGWTDQTTDPVPWAGSPAAFKVPRGFEPSAQTGNGGGKHFAKPGNGSPGAFSLGVFVMTERDDPSFTRGGLAKLRCPDGGWAEGALDEFWGGTFSNSCKASRTFSFAGQPAGQTSMTAFASGEITRHRDAPGALRRRGDTDAVPGPAGGWAREGGESRKSNQGGLRALFDSLAFGSRLFSKARN